MIDYQVGKPCRIPETVKEVGMDHCKCAVRKHKVFLNAEFDDVAHQSEICPRCRSVRLRTLGAAQTLPEFLRRVLPRELFLKLANEWIKEADSVMSNEFEFLRCEETVGSISNARIRARQLREAVDGLTE